MKTTHIAVLMTCYNRKIQTISCLNALFAQDQMDNFQLHVFLVDDDCTDGTGDAVRQHYPQVTVLRGASNLFWNGGMRLAFSEALKGSFDYYLWLNDDVILYPNAITNLIDTEKLLKKKSGKPAIIVGAMQDGKTGDLTYSGNRIKGWYAPLSYERIVPENVPILCDTVNGNCVLIPCDIARKVGNLSKEFTHGAGDYDYSLRAKKLGFSSYVAPGYVGTCPQNEIAGTCLDKSLPLEQRRQMLKKPTSLPPAKEWMFFARRHAGVLWPLYWLRTSIRIYMPSIWLFFRGTSN